MINKLFDTNDEADVVNDLLIYTVDTNSMKVADKDYYNFITLDIEKLFTLDVEYYSDFDLVILSDKKGSVHFLVYETESERYEL